MNPLENKKVAIVGGGPGGLTLARLLQMNGARVKVYERDVSRTTRVQGATLNINEESGLKAVRRAGLMEAFTSAYRPGADGLVIVDRDANVLLREPAGSTHDERPEIDRGPLRELLLDSLAPDTVVWNSRFVALERTEAAIRLSFADGPPVEADLVVAADGANSRLRPYVTSLRPVYSGVTVVEGTVDHASQVLPRIHALLEGGKICALGDAKSLFVVLKGDDSVAFYTGHKTHERWARECGIDFGDKAQVARWFAREFEGWEAFGELIAQASAPFVPRPQYCAPVDQAWAALSNLTLLGDAAHVMPPYAGEGVNMAMLDALELTECLLDTRHPDTRGAISAYETGMRARASESAAQTLRFTEEFHSSRAIPFFVDFFGAAAHGGAGPHGDAGPSSPVGSK